MIPTLMLFSMLLLTQIVVPVSSWTEDDHVFAAFGPLVDNLVINMYSNVDLLMGALQAGEVDVAGWAVPAAWAEAWSVPPYSVETDPDSIEMGPVKEMAVFEFDLNHKETIATYPGWTNPMTYPKFRQAIVHLINKTEYVEEILSGMAVVWDTMIPPWTVWFNDVCNNYYPYDMSLARAALDAGGFPEGETGPLVEGGDNVRVYPTGHEKAGQDLDPLILYIKSDDPYLMEAGIRIAAKLKEVGIPTSDNILPMAGCFEHVFTYQDFHLYTGYRMVQKDPDYLYDYWHSSMIPYPNFVWYDNATYDEAASDLKYAMNFGGALEACHRAQLIFAQDLGCIPLWGHEGMTAQRRYAEGNTNKRWHGFVNETGFGKRSWWSFISANCIPPPALPGGNVIYGLSNRILSLDPMRASTYWDWEVLNKVYEPLLRKDPYTHQYIPWLATGWNMDTYFDVDLQKSCTIVTFNLSPAIFWHDGEPFTADDVRFTIEYAKSLWVEGWASMYGHKVKDVYEIRTPGPFTVCVMMSVESMWALHWIAEIPILPSHAFGGGPEDMPDPYLIGTGPFKYEGGEAGTEPGTGNVPQEYVVLKGGCFRYCPIEAFGGINLQGDYPLPAGKSLMKRTVYQPAWPNGTVIFPSLDIVVPRIKCNNLHATVTPAWTGTWTLTETTGTGYSDSETITVQSQGPPVTMAFDPFDISADLHGALPYAFSASHTADAQTGRTCSYTTPQGTLVKTCLGDINGDGVCNDLIPDLPMEPLLLNVAFVLWENGGTYYANGDITGDGQIDCLDGILMDILV